MGRTTRSKDHAGVDEATWSFSKLSTNTNHRIIVGVDYGTTFTGISYIDTSNPAQSSLRDVHDIRTFPGPGREADAVWKTPSRIAYASENANCSANQWGFQVTPKMVSYSWTKLLLDQNARETKFDDPSLKRTEGDGMLTLPRNKTAVQVVRDYLEEVYEWTMEYLAKRISPEILEMTPIEYWFTVPAIWSDQAKEATLSAARQAGFGSGDDEKIYLVSEPEAASVATLKNFSEGGVAAKAKPGDGILICDCGGGTVDITSYKIIKMTPRLEFEELVEGIGGKCGSTYIDRGFHQWMSSKFGSHFDNLKFEKTGPGSRFMKEFESHKRDFGFSQDLNQIYEINLVIPGISSSEYYDDDESVVKLRGYHMLQFFQPVVDKIISLLNDQMDRANGSSTNTVVNQVVLVGGFGDSPYLNNQVRAWAQGKGTSLICPEDPQAAIARGAALRGLESVQLLRRRSRRHYGIVTNELFREGIDPESLATMDKWSGEKRCANRIFWAITKGQVIDEDTTLSFNRTRIHKTGDSLTYTSDLYSCSEDIAPDYHTDPAVEWVAALNHTMHSDSFSGFKTKTIDGEQCWLMEYKRIVSLGQKQGTLGFKVICNGEELGTAEIGYETGG